MRIRALLFCVSLLVGVSTCLADPPSLLDAIKRRDHSALKALLKTKADVNAAQPDGATPLAWAIYLDDTEAAELLLAAGAKVNTADEYGETPLTLACNNGNATLVKKLIASGADANAVRWDGSSALMLAANSGNVEIVKLLIERGANLNAAEKKRNQTALMWAAAEGHSEVVRLLIERGADAKAISNTGYSALAFAVNKNDAASVKALLAAGASPNFTLPDGSSLLIAAAAFRSNEAAIALVEGSADVKAADRRGNTPLHTAAQNGAIELVKRLLAAGADPNARNLKVPGAIGPGAFRAPAGEISPLHVAARANQLEIMKLLVAAGADTKLKAEDGTTLLMQAAGSSNIEVVQYAFQFDSDVKALTTTKGTVMHSAVSVFADQKEICKVIRFLAEKGVPLDERNAAGRTPIDIADILPLDQAVELLTDLIHKSGAKPKTPTKR